MDRPITQSDIDTLRLALAFIMALVVSLVLLPVRCEHQRKEACGPCADKAAKRREREAEETCRAWHDRKVKGCVYCELKGRR
jgi:hypothetical protein